MSDIRVFKSDDASSIFLQHGTIGAWPFHALQAVGNGDGTISIRNKSRAYASGDPFFEVANIPYGSYVDSADAAWGVSEVATVNALNALFVDSTASGVAPVLTSATSVTVTDIEAVNYFATATGAVGWEWGTLPAGLAVSSHNPRNLVGVFSDGAGTYDVDVTAVNYFGSVTETITFTVTATFADTRSVFCEQNDYLSASATTGSPFYRASNGSGASDAWSASVWFKPSTANQRQTILSFGGDDESNESQVRFEHEGGKRFRLHYGSNNNYLRLKTPDNSLIDEQWHHIFVTYDGGTTGVSSGSLSSYYGRFAIWVDGVSQSTSNSHKNSGTNASIKAEHFRVGEMTTNGDHLRGAYVNELAIWHGDETANVAAVYNSGSPHDLDLLGSAPDHWWRMGDGDTFPTIADAVGSLDFTMFNMSAANIATDAP